MKPFSTIAAETEGRPGAAEQIAKIRREIEAGLDALPAARKVSKVPTKPLVLVRSFRQR